MSIAAQGQEQIAANDAVDPYILVTAQRHQQSPNSAAAIDADAIAQTVNAVNVEDTIKYLPSLIVRKRHIGDTQAPLATRTSGLGASARSLIYADGALLSALIGNNNTSASPRWGLVSSEEIARIEVLYGPFSAAYPGNAIGAVVNITTRLPDKLEATATVATNIQTFGQYGTHRILPAYQGGGTVGDRFGALALFATFDHVTSNSQPLAYVTALQPGGASGAGRNVTGAFPGRNRTGQPIQILGASGLEHQKQDRFKLKAALDLGSSIRLAYTGALFLNDTHAKAQTYLADAVTGAAVFAGAVNIDGRLYTVTPSAFSSGVYSVDQRHWSHALSIASTGEQFDWQVIGTLFDFAHDVQRAPTTALPEAASGRAGTVTRLNGTGWQTLDAKAEWRSGNAAANSFSFGAHVDRFTVNSNRFATDDWITGADGQLNLQSRGKTRTLALWAQHVSSIRPDLILTLGGRYEWWRAYDGRNFSLAPAISVVQPRRSANRFSPKASVSWDADHGWTTRLSLGEAWRFPTVGELYQVVTSPVAAVPNPTLKPERALSEELAIERRNGRGVIRLSLFNEDVKDALISQSGALPTVSPTQIGTFVQNVDRTRARGAELAVQQSDLLPRFDLAGSVTLSDARTRKDTAFSAAVGKRLPSVPRWKATLVGTWRPDDRVALTAAMRYASRSFGTLDNSDIVGNTYQGFYKFLVVDVRATFHAGDRLWLGLGVDNLPNDKYFLFHPFPQRSFQADLKWKL